MSVPMELHKIVIQDQVHTHIIVLREVEGDRTLSMVISSPEAYAIDRRLKGIPFPRPLTHDLMATVIEALGAQIERIDITHLKNATFHASLKIRQGKRLVELDSRPSDAIALGVATNVPIYASEEVLDAAG